MKKNKNLKMCRVSRNSTCPAMNDLINNLKENKFIN